MSDLHPSKALVTGATSGIGRAVALKLAADGFEVIVHGRDTERGAQTVTEIERSGGKARFLPANLSDPGEIQRSIAYCLRAAVKARQLRPVTNYDELASVLYSSLQGAILQAKAERSAIPLQRFKKFLFSTVLR